MAFRKIGRILLFLTSVFMCLGFKVYPGIKGWRLDTSTTAGRKVFITLTDSGKTLTNDLPASDSLAASGSTLTETQILTSIISDYNSIQNSNLTLTTDADSDYAAYKTDHRIQLAEGSAAGLSSGEAQVTFNDGYITGCSISITPAVYSSAKAYARLVTHELGHCVGLEHPQETVWSIMSYFYNDEVLRLAIDDKMGIVHLYPKDTAYSIEKPNFGFSCATN